LKQIQETPGSKEMGKGRVSEKGGVVRESSSCAKVRVGGLKDHLSKQNMLLQKKRYKKRKGG